MLPDPCPECGFDGQSLKPPDLVATIKSLPRRWAAILEPPIGDDDADLAHAAAPGESSAADLGERAAAEIDAVADELRAGGAGTGSVTSAAARLADLLDTWSAEDWSRPGAADAVRRAAHAGVHWLKPAQRALDAARAAR